MDTVEVLLRAGISRDVRNKVERTPLHVAAQEGNIRIVNLLLQHGADVDCKDMVCYMPAVIKTRYFSCFHTIFSIF